MTYRRINFLSQFLENQGEKSEWSWKQLEFIV